LVQQSQATPDIERTGESLPWNHLGELWLAHTAASLRSGIIPANFDLSASLSGVEDSHPFFESVASEEKIVALARI
jgi:hypothetical protein